MTRTLPNLLVVTAVFLAAPLLQAQDCPCKKTTKTISGDWEHVTGGKGLANGVAAACMEGECENCPYCKPASCPSCPNCVAACDSLDTHVNAACRTASFYGEPLAIGSAQQGVAIVIGEQSFDAGPQPEQLANQLMEYLSASDHDPAHMRQVLQMALQTTADTAHQQAMLQNRPNNQPLPAARAQTFSEHEPFALQPQNNRLARLPDAAGNSLPLPVAVRNPSEPVIDSQRKTEMDLRQVQRDQAAIQEMITTIQKDMQRMAENLSQLHVESRINLPQNQNLNTWNSTPAYGNSAPVTSAMNRAVAQDEYVASLQREVALLRQQLQSMPRRSSMSNGMNRVQQADFEQSLRLQPRRSPTMPLTPATTASMTVSYYVGDLMEPPFHSATLRLMQYIKANVSPDSWKSSQMIQITEPSISLTITQSRANHEQIAELLRQVRTGARTYMPESTRR